MKPTTYHSLHNITWHFIPKQCREFTSSYACRIKQSLQCHVSQVHIPQWNKANCQDTSLNRHNTNEMPLLNKSKHRVSKHCSSKHVVIVLSNWNRNVSYQLNITNVEARYVDRWKFIFFVQFITNYTVVHRILRTIITWTFQNSSPSSSLFNFGPFMIYYLS